MSPVPKSQLVSYAVLRFQLLISPLKPRLPAQGFPSPLSLFGLLTKSSSSLDNDNEEESNDL